MDYLMTSDFNEGLTPEEFKFLLLKFRYHYRLLNGKNDILKTEMSSKIREIQDEKKKHENSNNNWSLRYSEMEDNYNKLKLRNLSWKERFLGKIIINENEN